MQEIHSVGGARFLGAGAGGGDRRLRPNHHHNSNNNQNQQALKCPRCDSLNTKFCYYNNYNLSQPRHFCKSCRRYWTKGGVLRNVPVGGGCRKSKRSKPKISSSETSTAAAAATTPLPAPPAPSSQPKMSNSHSSSESSSLTAAAAVTAAASEALSAPSSNSASNNLLDNHQDSKFFVPPNSNPSFEPGVMEQGDSGIFSEIGNLTNLITSSTNEALAFGFDNIPAASSFQFSSQWQKGVNMSDHHHQDLKFPEMTTTAGSLLDQTVPMDLSAVQDKIANGGFGPLDWQESTDRGLFDLPNTVDQSYWSHSQWNQDNPSLFHLP